MFIVNKGRGHGFLRCSCGFSVVLKNPFDHRTGIQKAGHRTPFEQPCGVKNLSTEDLAHEFRTDVLQLRIDESIAVPKDLASEQVDVWLTSFFRTLSEAIRLASARLLGVDQNEISATVRSRLFGYPEVIIYDSVAGGAGYCRMLVTKYSVRDVLRRASEVLDCPMSCTNSCVACLQDYDNQAHWDQFDRKPVLAWLASLLALQTPTNPFTKFKAARIPDEAVLPLLNGEFDSAHCIWVIAPALFDLRQEAASIESFIANETAGLVKWLVGWMTKGNTMEIAVLQPPVVTPDYPSSVYLANWLGPCVADDLLRLWQLPARFDGRAWPRILFDPGREGARCYSRQPD